MCVCVRVCPGNCNKKHVPKHVERARGGGLGTSLPTADARTPNWEVPSARVSLALLFLEYKTTSLEEACETTEVLEGLTYMACVQSDHKVSSFSCYGLLAARRAA